MGKLELKSVRKSFQAVEVIHGIDLVAEDGSFTVLVGPSGCGKSTLLRMIAGLEEVTSGEIYLDGERCDHRMPSATGFGVPKSSTLAFWKKEFRSRNAAKPTPST